MMWNGVSLARRSMVFFIGALLVAAFAGSVLAVTSKNFTYSDEKTGFYSIHPLALSPASDDIDFSFALGGQFTSTGNACAGTGLTLPHGARMIDLKVKFLSDDQSNLSVYIYAVHLVSGTNIIIEETIPDDSNFSKLKTFPISGDAAIVDNARYMYGFSVCVAAGTQFRGARVRYKYSNAGD